VLVHHAYGVDVAVHVPTPVDEVDPEISRLQVGGLTLDDEDPPGHDDAGARLWLNPHLTLTTGKAAAQVGHASQLLWQWLSPDAADAWVRDGAPLDVVVAAKSEWDDLVATVPVVVTDGGFTEVPPGTITVVAAPVSPNRRTAP
jgi:peptidyl-tRNA hydrolase